eukprot:scaffold102963_cov71-Phaeocystis_antarctica.AAC.2
MGTTSSGARWRSASSASTRSSVRHRSAPSSAKTPAEAPHVPAAGCTRARFLAKKPSWLMYPPVWRSMTARVCRSCPSRDESTAARLPPKSVIHQPTEPKATCGPRPAKTIPMALFAKCSAWPCRNIEVNAVHHRPLLTR